MIGVLQRFTAIGLAASLLLFITANELVVQCAENPKSNWKPSTAGDDIFTNVTVLKIAIEIAPRDLSLLRGSTRTTGNPQLDHRFNVPCTVREGGKSYTNVVVHLKGSMGSFRPVDDNPGLTLIFDKNVKGQTFHGLKRISLNNSVQDPTYLHERLARETFLRAGIPVPRAGFATVRLNDRNLGMHVLLEGTDKVFLKHYFHDVSGNLYESGLANDINPRLPVISGDGREDRSDLIRLTHAMAQPREELFAALEKVLDVDRFIRMIALEIILCHWDGYALHRNNYRLYHDMDKDRFMLIPHGMDEALGGQSWLVDQSITPPTLKGKLAVAIRSTPEGSARYLAAVKELATNYFDVRLLTNRVNTLSASVRSAMQEPASMQTGYYDQLVQRLNAFIAARGASLKQQVLKQEASLAFGADHTVRLSGWKAKAVPGAVPAILGESFEINAAGAGTVATSVRLLPGRYRFEGEIRLENLVADPADPAGGACLHMNWTDASRRLTGTTDGWVHYSHRFQITDGPIEVELACDVRGQSGKALFKADSLKLIQE